jgi:hypothetical protein
MTTYITKRAHELGIEKVDAKKPLEIEVKPVDIRLASQKNSKCCAFARAAKRENPEIKHAYFFLTAAWLEYPDKMVRYFLPPSVQKEIVSFDRSKITAPGVYQLTPPSRSKSREELLRRSKARKRGGTADASKPKRSKAIRHQTAFVRTTQEPTEE